MILKNYTVQGNTLTYMALPYSYQSSQGNGNQRTEKNNLMCSLYNITNNTKAKFSKIFSKLDHTCDRCHGAPADWSRLHVFDLPSPLYLSGKHLWITILRPKTWTVIIEVTDFQYSICRDSFHYEPTEKFLHTCHMLGSTTEFIHCEIQTELCETPWPMAPWTIESH